jgi:hypothetical protein
VSNPKPLNTYGFGDIPKPVVSDCSRHLKLIAAAMKRGEHLPRKAA